MSSSFTWRGRKKFGVVWSRSGHPRQPRLEKARRWEWIIPFSAFVLFVLTCFVVSGRQVLSQDEIFTHLLLGSPTFGHMMAAVKDGVDGSPPVYLSLMWIWSSAFGHSDLALRLFSSVVLGLGFGMSWLLGRRLAGFWPATLASVGVFLFNPQIFAHSAEGRNYALVITLLATTLWQFEKISRMEPTPLLDLLVQAALVAALVLTHLFGFIFSAIILLALILADAAGRRFRPVHYLMFPLGWLGFVPWVPAFLQQSKIGDPWFWIPEPPGDALLHPSAYLFGVPWPLVLSALVLSGLAYVVLRKMGHRIPVEVSRMNGSFWDPAPLAAALLIILVPLVTWTYSKIFTSLWLDRYQIPAAVSWVILLSLLFRHILTAASVPVVRCLKRPEITHALALILGFLVTGYSYVYFYSRASELDFNRQRINSLVDSEWPIATQYSAEFLYLTIYQPRVRCYYILDWHAAIRSKNRGHVADFNIMVATKKHFPDLRILPSVAFLASCPRFEYVDHHEIPWIQDWFSHNPKYRVTARGNDLLVVEQTPH